MPAAADPLVLRIAGLARRRGGRLPRRRARVGREDADRRRDHRAAPGPARAAGARWSRTRSRSARRCSPSRCPASPGRSKSTAGTTIFTRGALTEVAQHDVRVNGVDMNVGATAPRLPIIEPERVSTPPLAITLSSAYDYRAGRPRPRGGARLLHRRVHAAGRDGRPRSPAARGSTRPASRSCGWRRPRPACAGRSSRASSTTCSRPCASATPRCGCRRGRAASRSIRRRPAHADPPRGGDAAARDERSATSTRAWRPRTARTR